MTNNFKFIYKCNEYGINKDNYVIDGEHIILRNDENNKSILLDSDYNVIAINEILDSSDILYYSKLIRLKLLPYPFDEYSFLDIMNLSKRFIICGNDIIINGIKVSSLSNSYKTVIKFIIYLNQTIQDVYHLQYNNKTSIPSYEYLKVHINSFNSTHKSSETKKILDELHSLLNIDNDIVEDRLNDEYDIPYGDIDDILDECKNKKLELTSNN